MSQLWERSLHGGLGSLQGKVCSLTDYFEGHPIAINTSFEWEGLYFTPVQTVHIMNGMEIVPSYGLMIRESKGPENLTWPYQLFITTDSQFCPHQIQDFYFKSNIIIHDCETAPYFSGVHAHYNDLNTLPGGTKAKMWLCHYQPNPPQDAIKDGFKGFLQRKQILEF